MWVSTAGPCLGLSGRGCDPADLVLLETSGNGVLRVELQKDIKPIM